MNPADAEKFEKRYSEGSERETRVTLRLSEAMARAIDDLTARTGGSKAEAIRQAVGTQLYLMQSIAEGDEVLLKKSNGDVSKLVFQDYRPRNPKFGIAE